MAFLPAEKVHTPEDDLLEETLSERLKRQIREADEYPYDDNLIVEESPEEIYW